MALLLSRGMIPWCPAKARIFRLVVVTALLVMAPGLLLRQKVAEIVADHSSQARRMVRKFIISDDDAYSGFLVKRGGVQNTDFHRSRRAEADSGVLHKDMIWEKEKIQYRFGHGLGGSGVTEKHNDDFDHVKDRQSERDYYFHLDNINNKQPQNDSDDSDHINKKQRQKDSDDSGYIEEKQLNKVRNDLDYIKNKKPETKSYNLDSNKIVSNKSKNDSVSKQSRRDSTEPKELKTDNGDYNDFGHKGFEKKSLIYVQTKFLKKHFSDLSDAGSVSADAGDTHSPPPRNAMKSPSWGTSRGDPHLLHKSTQSRSASSDTGQLDVVKVAQRHAHWIGCEGVLTRAVVGKWIPRPYSQAELHRVQAFLNNTRDKMGFPPTLQRPDKKCGNVSFGEYTFGDKITYRWFRALCNPFGKSPCCQENRCVSRSVDQCACEGCMDLRQQIHAELATWLPTDAACQLSHYRPGEEACTALEEFTVHFVGDSLLRQIFVALLHLLQGPQPQLDSKDEFYQCRGYYSYLPYCSRYLPFEVNACGSKHVVLKRSFLKRSYDAPEVVKEIQRHTGQRNSLVVLGMGMHDHLNHKLILRTVVKPILAAAAEFNSSWPRLVWVAPHAPGLLKSPWLPSQLAPGVLSFNSHMNTAFTSAGIPVLDTFGLTKDGVMTYDGLHYGEGLNMLKAQILLNYVQEIRKNERESKKYRTAKDG